MRLSEARFVSCSNCFFFLFKYFCFCNVLYLPLVSYVVLSCAFAVLAADIVDDVVCCVSSWQLSSVFFCIVYQLIRPLLQLKHKYLSSFSGCILYLSFITSIIFGPHRGSYILIINRVYVPQMKHTFSAVSDIDSSQFESSGEYCLHLSDDILIWFCFKFLAQFFLFEL